MAVDLEKILFMAASGLDEIDDRRAFIEFLKNVNPTIYENLLQLYKLEEVAQSFFEFPPRLDPDCLPNETSGEEEIGAYVGRYRLITLLGEGGCGRVYLAEQEIPMRRRVALKIVKLGMDTEAVVARFELERQALAQMDHPHIARVLDAGATEFGRPYFVMELVHGEKITDFCDAKRMPIEQRISLFISVCRAVQHAHQKGVIHRDLKPSNILVHFQDTIPVPKIIDFGIAKAATESVPVSSATSLTNNFLGTPAYMSPEQAVDSANVDTRSDIYSLGAILYELVSGCTPFDSEKLRATAQDEMRRTICELEPLRPSAAFKATSRERAGIIAANRAADDWKLAAQIEGEVDWIVIKAMEKDRVRRYDTASGLAMELHRILNCEPILARPPSNLYRLGKLVRRNRILFAASLIAMCGLFIGFSGTTWMFFRERSAYRDAEESRRGESELRAESDARAQIAQAALLISRGELENADKLIDKIKVPVKEPSLEAANVFRELAIWNVGKGRWATAAEDFSNLQEANQVDKSNTTAALTFDLLGAGPAFVLAGDPAGFRRFVQLTLTRFAGTTDPVAAEQVVKTSLILPADPATLQGLVPFVKVVKSAIDREKNAPEAHSDMLAWRSLALSLYEYRLGNFSEASKWAWAAMAYPSHFKQRDAMIDSMVALADFHNGMPEKATIELGESKEIVSTKFPHGITQIDVYGDGNVGQWHDWVIAYILAGEAEDLLNSKKGQHP